MSETYPPAKRSNKTRLVSQLYDYTSNIAELRGYDSNRGLAAGTAAAVLGLGLDKLEGKHGKLAGSDLEYLEAEADLIDNVALSAEDMQGEQAHFMDRFMDIMVRNTMPNSPEGADIQARVNDPSRAKKPPLSIRVFVSNLKQLSSKMGAFFKLQYGVIHVATWQKPTKTLVVLVAYTCVCLWPHLVLSFPLLFMLFGLIVPGYLYRHPMDTPEIIPVKKRGQSLLQYLNLSDESSLFTDILDKSDNLALDNDTSSSTDSTGTSLKGGEKPKMNDDVVDTPDKLDSKDKKKFVKSQVTLLINMRDLQNLTGDLLKSINKGESVVNDLAGFKDERLSTFIFYIVIVVTSVVLFLGRFIPWRLIFIQSGWAALGLCHPNTKKYLVGLKKNQSQVDNKVAEAQNNPKEKSKSIFDDFHRQDIIVDELPEVRIVEIYELQRKDVFKHEWKFYGYSKRLYDFCDSVRVSGKLPHGVNHLSKVSPPREWKYDFGYANNWRIDTSPEEFLSLRNLDQTHLKIVPNDEEGWIYDKLPIDEDTTQEFRRRRLYRSVYRYSRPFKKFELE